MNSLVFSRDVKQNVPVPVKQKGVVVPLNQVLNLVQGRFNNTDRLMRESETRITNQIKKNMIRSTYPLKTNCLDIYINPRTAPPSIYDEFTRKLVVGNSYNINLLGLFDTLSASNNGKTLVGYYVYFDALKQFDFNYSGDQGFYVGPSDDEPFIPLTATIISGNGVYNTATIDCHFNDGTSKIYSTTSFYRYVAQ